MPICCERPTGRCARFTIVTSKDCYPRDLWLRLLGDAGFLPTVMSFDHSELEPGTYEVFVVRRLAV